jgi:hypothetical protein
MDPKDPMGWPRFKKSKLPGDFSIYPDPSAVEAIRNLLRMPPAALAGSTERRNRGGGKIEYSMKLADSTLVFILQIDEGKPMAFVATRDTEEDGDTLVYKWVSEADLESMNKRNVTNRKSRRRRRQRRSTRRN